MTNRDEIHNRGYSDGEVAVLVKLEVIETRLDDIKGNYVNIQSFGLFRNLVIVANGAAAIALVISIISIII